jgi:DNA-binding NtrC family response regulator
MDKCIDMLDLAGKEMQSLADVFTLQSGADCQVKLHASFEKLLQHLREDASFHTVVLHCESDDGRRRGLDLIESVHDVDSTIPVVVVADRGDVASAARAMEAGAADFLVLGGQLDQRVGTLLLKQHSLLEMAERNRTLDDENAALREIIEPRFEMVGRSPQIKKLIETIRRVAKVPRPLLIVGERGTGKELVARAIHLAASDAPRPMITVNCAAFGDTLLESELFGHEKGAFTGADKVRRGKFEQAGDGTLFLDEVGHMSLPFQQKILRVVEYSTFTRVGGSDELKTSARVIAATNCDLNVKIRDGEFLCDLYDRLSFEVVEVAPLRRRRSDIGPLAQHFLDQFAREIPAFAGKRLSSAAIEMLEQYHFPGNVRELKNIIERAAYRDTTNEITPEDIGMLAEEEVLGKGTFKEKIDAFSRRLILDSLSHSGGNQAQAARLLGLSYHQFRYYAKKLTP